MESDDFCRQVEDYLCRRNGGHLVRITGPAFDLVREWASRGIPLRVVFRGIDARIVRAAARGPRRRPMRIEFCEADVLDAFDRWRRSIGLIAPQEDAASPQLKEERRAKPRRSLSSHIDRVVARLTAMRAGSILPEQWDRAIEQCVRDLDHVRSGAERLRGQARERAIAELAAIEARLFAGARAHAGESLLIEIDRDARLELEPFAGRLPQPAYDVALETCRARLLREALGLPAILFE